MMEPLLKSTRCNPPMPNAMNELESIQATGDSPPGLPPTNWSSMNSPDCGGPFL